MAHTLTYSVSNTISNSFTVKVNGNAVDSPYQLTNGDIITLDGGSSVWDSGGPSGDKYTSWQVSANGTDIYNETLSLSGDINITAEEVPSDYTSSHPFSATINYTESSTPRLSVDVSTLAGWANLSAGEKSITIVAKADGFKDSAPSASVKVTKAAATKTLAALVQQEVPC